MWSVPHAPARSPFRQANVPRVGAMASAMAMAFGEALYVAAVVADGAVALSTSALFESALPLYMAGWYFFTLGLFGLLNGSDAGLCQMRTSCIQYPITEPASMVQVCRCQRHPSGIYAFCDIQSPTPFFFLSPPHCPPLCCQMREAI
eukprot:6186739-Pleurochrysis_carterae.AAC.3